MKAELFFLLAPILGVMGRTAPLRAHRLNPGSEGLANVYPRYPNVKAQAKALHVDLKRDVKVPIKPGDITPRAASHLEARYTIEQGEDGSSQKVSGLPAGWRYQDCYADTNGKTLYSFTEDAISFSSDGYENGNAGDPQAVSATTCINYCASKGYPYAGLEYHYQCLCGYRVRPNNAPSTGCTGKCYGFPLETCGGDNRMQIYVQDAGPTYPPRTPTTLPNNFAYVNCYNTGTGASLALPGGVSTTSATNTGASCVTYCNAAGYSYAGTQNQQCFCGNTLLPGATTATCVQQCPGDKTEACGGTQKMSIYQKQAAVSGVSVCFVCVLCLLLDCCAVLLFSRLFWGHEGRVRLELVLMQVYGCLRGATLTFLRSDIFVYSSHSILISRAVMIGRIAQVERKIRMDNIYSERKKPPVKINFPHQSPSPTQHQPSRKPLQALRCTWY